MLAVDVSTDSLGLDSLTLSDLGCHTAMVLAIRKAQGARFCHWLRQTDVAMSLRCIQRTQNCERVECAIHMRLAGRWRFSGPPWNNVGPELFKAAFVDR